MALVHDHRLPVHQVQVGDVLPDRLEAGEYDLASSRPGSSEGLVPLRLVELLGTKPPMELSESTVFI